MKGNGNHEFGRRTRRALRGFDDQPLEDADRNGIEVGEAGARVLELLHPISDLARVGDRGQAGVEVRDRSGVEVWLESRAAPPAERVI
ncbi:MAG: hypothetical protein VX466_09690 [Myxococcota bacterium]|nr:hypothetical protein [Myxococcota bacterium]